MFETPTHDLLSNTAPVVSLLKPVGRHQYAARLHVKRALLSKSDADCRRYVAAAVLMEARASSGLPPTPVFSGLSDCCSVSKLELSHS